MRLTKPQQNALLGRAPFTLSGDDTGPEGEQWWIWCGENDKGRNICDQLVDKGLADPDGRDDGYLTYLLTEEGRDERRRLRGR